MSMARFWAKVQMTLSCWEWSGSRDALGYGMFKHKGKTRRAHRISWESRYGKVPDGLLVLHHCDNPSCVNPAHLFLGTNADNNRDMVSKGRARYPGRPGVGFKLSEVEVEQIRSRVRDGESQSAVAKHFGVNQSLVSRICSGQYWKRASGGGSSH